MQASLGKNLSLHFIVQLKPQSKSIFDIFKYHPKIKPQRQIIQKHIDKSGVWGLVNANGVNGYGVNAYIYIEGGVSSP